MTETNKSLKPQKTYNDIMLARQEQEREIITVPLRKKEILEITSVKLSVYDSKNIKLSVPVFNVRSITPIKKDKIKIQFYEPKILSNGNTIQKRKYLEYKLEKSDFTAMHVCRKILKEYERLNSRSANRYGFLLLHGWEHIVSVYHDTKTNKGTGLLYVTNAGLVLETDEGVIFDVPYQYVELVTDHKKKVRIVWREPWNSYNNFRFDLQMDKKTDRDVVRIQIRDAFVRYRKKIGHEFIELEKKYESISYDEIYNLINTRNPEYQRYLLLHVGHTFGYVSPKFETSDSQNIVTCKLAGYDLDIISDISEEEAVQRKKSLDFSVKTVQGNKKWKELEDVQLEMESQCSDKDEFAKLSKSKEYKKIISAKDDLKTNHGIPGLDNVVTGMWQMTYTTQTP